MSSYFYFFILFLFMCYIIKLKLMPFLFYWYNVSVSELISTVNSAFYKISECLVFCCCLLVHPSASRAELMMMTVSEIVSHLITAHEKGNDVNLNK